jgi:hypothetical protein
MKAWSSAPCWLDAIARDCWCAWSANCGDLTSGTQIWIGRRPCSRSRSRCARTRMAVGVDD